ncbi:phytanoyl-CoA dioxygenase [Arsenicitalea aurantiaca]|uniref:Phytanoyl-CoA dioxygenase n=2 Tax=Arsenicitalea aurantiaca TaxID=1783274 RepID=A0A433XB39_9HYPH|nr:phytanoyl-CoA dioxygenase family protein [Arsenicitalea aurantiaca]RUT31307.1 phytanoyl-CoA dioxygenase [Arsenicitalea aurantiaca]
MHNSSGALGGADIDHFITEGFLRIDGAFSAETADRARAILWRASGCDPEDPRTWTRPVVRIGELGLPPFAEAVGSRVLHGAFDALVGEGRWLPRNSLGTFPIRFPSPEDPGDAGWHIDVSFGTEDPDFLSWRANITSRGRALLMLFLFSDVGEKDAPTRIRAGSHLDIARRLAPAGPDGLTLRELAATGFAESAHRPEVLAVGAPGTVYLCHPFIVHAAQPHHGTEPRFMAQPPLLPRGEFAFERSDGAYNAVERAIRLALER